MTKNCLRITHTESSCGWGGQEIRILEEMSGFQERGHSVRLLCPREAPIYKAAQERSLPVTPIDIRRKNLRGLISMWRALRENRTDILNTHSSTDSWLGALACNLMRKKPVIVRTRHVSSPVTKNLPTRWLYKHATRFLVTTGKELRETLINEMGYPKHRIRSVPTGIDPNRFYPKSSKEARAQLNLPQDKVIIGIAATLRSWKGHSYLIDAFHALNPADSILLIIGDGPQYANIQEQVKRLKLDDRVRLVGHIHDVAPWLQALDIFCLPSYANEGVPQSILQAMHCGLPVISTPVGSISEAIFHNKTGILIPTKDSEALTKALENLINNASFRNSLAEDARSHALGHFTLQKMLDDMEDVFYDLIK